jgi:hypothetical protein
MFDFLAHWFAKTEIINNGTTSGDLPNSKGKYSLDTTILCIIVVLAILFYFANNRINKIKRKYQPMIPMQNIPIINQPH